MSRRQWQEISSSSQSPGNVAARLQRRESQSRSPHAFKRATLERFDNFKLKRQYDLHMGVEDDEKLLSSVYRRRSKITEIISTEHLLITLTFSGVCTAFSRDTKHRVCIVNNSPEEVIRSIFCNKENNSLLTISVARGDSSSSLRCRSTSLADIRHNHPEMTTRLFPNESLEWPGFVELDEINRKVVTFSNRDCTYKVWDLRSYALLYELKDTNIHEVKVSPGVLLVIYQRPPTNSHLALAIFDIETGKTVHSFTCPLNRTKRIDFIEQYSDKLLIKQVNENLRIVDIQTRSETVVSYPELSVARGYIYLYQLQRFMSYDERSVHVWNFRGEKVTSFDEHHLLHSECPQSAIHISEHQEFLFSLSKCPTTASPCITVSDIRSGRFLGRFALPPSFPERDLLASVSALSYDEAKHELLCGTADGRVLVWAS